MRSIALLLALLAIAIPARADWVELGVAAQCASDSGSFQVIPVVATGTATHNVRAPAGAHTFPIGSDQTYTCNLGSSDVELKLSVWRPQERGEGQGAGVIMISSLVAAGVAVLPASTRFNWQAVPGEPFLTSIVLTRQSSGLASKLCYSQGWDWEQPYAGERCEITQVGR